MQTAITVVIWLIAILLAIGILSSIFKVVRPTERGLIERFGKYHRFANPGLNILIPFGIESLKSINITENIADSGKREMITLDSLNCQIEAQIYFKVKPDEASVKSATYNVNNYQVQIVELAKTTLRNIIGTLSLKDANSKRGDINKLLFDQLSVETKSWGIEIVRTELKEITPPEEVQKVMNRVVVANNEKVAAIDFATAAETKADGEKRAAVKMAEGEKLAVVLRAEGEKLAEIAIAEGKAQAIKLVNEAAQSYFKGDAQVLKKLETVGQALNSNSKIVLPSGESIINVIGNLAGIATEGK